MSRTWLTHITSSRPAMTKTSVRARRSPCAERWYWIFETSCKTIGGKMNEIDWRKSKSSHRSKSWVAAGALLAFFAASVPAHAVGYKQTNLVASNDSYGASIVDPTLINVWGIAIRPAGLGGHFWVESNGGGTTNQYIVDVGGAPLYADNLHVVSIPGPTAGNAVPFGTPTGVVFNPGSQFKITQWSITEPAKFIFATDTGTISAWTERKNPDGSFDRPAFAKPVVDRSQADAHYFGVALGP